MARLSRLERRFKVNLAVKGLASPGVHELRPIGEYQQDPVLLVCSPEGTLNTSSELLSIQCRSSMAMIRGPNLRTL